MDEEVKAARERERMRLEDRAEAASKTLMDAQIAADVAQAAFTKAGKEYEQAAADLRAFDLDPGTWMLAKHRARMACVC